MKMARVGVLLDRHMLERLQQFRLNSFEQFVTEILAHRGIPFEVVHSLDEITNDKYDLLIAAVVADTRQSAERLWRFAEQGGTLIGYGGLNAMADRLGFIRGESSGTGYAELPEPYPSDRPLRFLAAQPWLRMADSGNIAATEAGALALGRPDGERVGPALLRITSGQGRIERWTVDIPTTIVGLQQGLKPVLEDGVPAPDGTAAVDDGVLKADDVMELDWTADRLLTETGMPYFAFPYADLWRDVLVGHLIGAAAERGLSLPFVGYWPDGIDHVALVSHDSDGNRDEHAVSTLETLAACGIRSTWCMLESGYSAPMYDRIRAEGHEVAFHYNAVEADEGIWDEAEFSRQLDWLKRAAGTPSVASNKNHLTRIEGWGELFRWCEKYGIEVDQTRGPSKKGNVGFIFGTCHPYFPIAWADEHNRFYNVLEIGFLTQDLDIGKWSDSSVIAPFLEQVREVEGVAHFLFHQIHIHNREEVRRAMRTLADQARELGYPFWTSQEINDWERSRRTLTIEKVEANGSCSVNAPTSLEKSAVVWAPLPEHVQGDRAAAPVSDEGAYSMRYGIRCRKTVVLPGGTNR
ncbi:hypothetical protein PV433_04890 [Paenibacillus sp. GYB004]|uniref:hypothetical protein n=1 Tax=Paenibacillus sp. GYB004 TaxID=2994393 RepID=UPI002F9661EC